MKICPACRNQYTDDTLQFCLQDGTPLTPANQAKTPTDVPDRTETETIVHPRPQVQQPGSRASGTGIAVAVTVVVMLLLFAAIGGGVWLYYKNQGNESAKITVNTANVAKNSNQNANINTVPTETSKPSPSQSVTAAATASPAAVDEGRIKNEIAQRISNWRSSTESQDMSGLRSLYAPVLDFYYTKRRVRLESVLDDKERAFGMYDSISMDVSVRSIAPDDSGETATAIVQKEWTFDGEDPFCGVTRSEVRFRRVNGAWLIVGERDVPGTFRRTC